MADRIQKQATERRRKQSKGFMKNKTTPAVELIEAPATSVPVLISSNKKLASVRSQVRVNPVQVLAVVPTKDFGKEQATFASL